jgi:NAD(P)-dependent dehydrogenase (short-subunit alcohol dehydrogenase family)
MQNVDLSHRLHRMNSEAAATGFEHVLITGGTGFVGTALSDRLLELGSRVSVLMRDRGVRWSTSPAGFRPIEDADTAPLADGGPQRRHIGGDERPRSLSGRSGPVVPAVLSVFSRTARPRMHTSR